MEVHVSKGFELDPLHCQVNSDKKPDADLLSNFQDILECPECLKAIHSLLYEYEDEDGN